MKRFVTYLYECERGNKSKNVGFIRVNVRNEETKLEVYIRNILRPYDVGKIYALIYKKDLLGIELGEIKISSGQSDSHIVVQTEDIIGSGASIKDIMGIGIRLESGEYIASCWKDEYADEIVRGEFLVKEEVSKHKEVILEETTCIFDDSFIKEEKVAPQIDEEANLVAAEGICSQDVTYEKIDLSQIRDLPSPNWHFTTNSFLVHGFWNYGYLVLKKEMEGDKEKVSLGVPGIFEKPEAVMAILFGFPTFAEIPQEMVAADANRPMDFPQKEKNQEAEVGTFGCWFVTLQE